MYARVARANHEVLFAGELVVRGTSSVAMFWLRKSKRAELAEDVQGEEAFDGYIEDYKRTLLRLISDRAISKRAGEPLAPWFCYHYPLEFDRKRLDALGVPFLMYAEKDSFFWHTLNAARCTFEFRTHLASLELQDRIDYFRRFDLGPNWPDRLAWFELAFDLEEISDADYDKAHNVVFEHSE